MSDRLLVFVLTGQKNGEIVMRVDLSGLDTKRRFKLLHCAIEIARLRERNAKIHTRGNAFGISINSFAKLISSFCVPLRLERNLAATQMQTFSRDRILQTIHKRIRDSHTNSS